MPLGSGTASGDWVIVGSPNTAENQYNVLYGVTCSSESDCWAVGYYFIYNNILIAQTLIERWDGTSWAIVSSPNSNASEDNVLYGVTCVSASDCWAVGDYVGSDATHTLIEHWDGTSWAIVSSPNSNASESNYLVGVTCVSASDCWAVGDYVGVDATHTLIEHWDGTSWAIVSSPNTDASQNNFLVGVTCVSASDCWAVGYYYPNNENTPQTLIERWDGIAWAIVSSPNTGTSQNYLVGVTCASASDCWAVGYYRNDNFIAQTLIERWDGTSWTTVSSPNTAANEPNFLLGVTCVSASDCWAVGYHNENTPQTLIERWDGTSWAIVSSPNTAGDQSNVLYGVTCVSASDCWAVGYYYGGSALQTLVLRYTASPTSRPTPTPRSRPIPAPRPSPPH